MKKTANGKPIEVAVVGSSKFGIYGKISPEKTYNMFISDGWLINTPGYKKVLEIEPEGEGRGGFVSIRGNFLLIVVNQNVYRIDTNLAVTFIGAINTLVGEVFMDENLNQQICIVDGQDAWIYYWGSGAPNLTKQTLSPSFIPNYVSYHNTFFLFGNGQTNGNGANWYVYSNASNTTISETSQLALQTKPDYARAVVRLPGQSNNVLVLGTTVSEIWNNVGGNENYRRVSSISIDYGCLSVSTIAVSDMYVAWLAVNETNNPIIMIYSEGGAKPISTDGIDHVLAAIQFPAESTAMFSRSGGHLFYQITFFNPVDNLTLAYDFNTKQFFHLSDADVNYHPARDYLYFNLNTYFVSLNNGSLYQKGSQFTTYDENVTEYPNIDPTMVNVIPRTRITENVYSGDTSQYIANLLTLVIDQGNDPFVTDLSLTNPFNYIITEDTFVPPDDIVTTEQGSYLITEDSTAGSGAGAGVIGAISTNLPYQPRVDLSISQDGGVTWSNYVAAYLNAVGHRKNILRWYRLGSSNFLSFKFKFWGLSRFVVQNAVLEVKG